MGGIGEIGIDSIAWALSKVQEGGAVVLGNSRVVGADKVGALYTRSKLNRERRSAMVR